MKTYFSLSSFFLCYLFCSSPVFAEEKIEEVLTQDPGIFCNAQEAYGVSRLFTLIEHFEIDENMMFKENHCDVFLAMAMHRDASPGCFLVNLSATSSEAGIFWLFNLRLLFSQYGDVGAWPLPDVAMKNEYLKNFSDGQEVREKHLSYLYNAWSKYLLKPETKKKRWAAELDYKASPFPVKTALVYSGPDKQQTEKKIKIIHKTDDGNASLEHCWQEGTCLDSFFGHLFQAAQKH